MNNEEPKLASESFVTKKHTWPLNNNVELPTVQRVADIGICHLSHRTMATQLRKLSSCIRKYFADRGIEEIWDLAAEVDYIISQSIEQQILDDAADLGLTGEMEREVRIKDYGYSAPPTHIVLELMDADGNNEFHHRRNTSLLEWLESGCDGLEESATTLADYFAIIAFHMMCMTSCCFLVLAPDQPPATNAPSWIRYGEKLLITDEVNSEERAAEYLIDGFAALVRVHEFLTEHRVQSDEAKANEEKDRRSANARHAAAQKHQVAKRDYQRLYQHYADNRDRYTSYADASVRIDQKALKLEAEGGTYSAKKVAEMLGKLDKDMQKNRKA